MAKSRKDNIDSFDGMFNGTDEQTPKESKLGRPVENREKKVRKSIAILPSIYDNASKIAYVDRTSVSELIAELLGDYIAKHKDKLVEYERIKKD